MFGQNFAQSIALTSNNIDDSGAMKSFRALDNSQSALKGDRGEGIATTVFPIASAGAISEGHKPNNGYSSGQAMPITLMGTSGMARTAPRIGGRCTCNFALGSVHAA